MYIDYITYSVDILYQFVLKMAIYGIVITRYGFLFSINFPYFKLITTRFVQIYDATEKLQCFT